jgi:hypothetical protein
MGAEDWPNDGPCALCDAAASAIVECDAQVILIRRALGWPLPRAVTLRAGVTFQPLSKPRWAQGLAPRRPFWRPQTRPRA